MCEIAPSRNIRRPVIRKITWLSLRKFSLLDQIKQKSKSEAFKKHWILPQCKRNARKAKKGKKTPLKNPALFSIFPHYFAFFRTISRTIWQNFPHYFPFFPALYQKPCIIVNSSIQLDIIPERAVREPNPPGLVFSWRKPRFMS